MSTALMNATSEQDVHEICKSIVNDLVDYTVYKKAVIQELQQLFDPSSDLCASLYFKILKRHVKYWRSAWIPVHRPDTQRRWRRSSSHETSKPDPFVQTDTFKWQWTGIVPVNSKYKFYRNLFGSMNTTRLTNKTIVYTDWSTLQPFILKASTLNIGLKQEPDERNGIEILCARRRYTRCQQKRCRMPNRPRSIGTRYNLIKRARMNGLKPVGLSDMKKDTLIPYLQAL
jgi:hypothetical protein